MLTREQFTEKFVEVIAHASSQLPPDVLAALERGRDAEAPGSLAAKALDSILTNVEMARGSWQPICQDTGTPIVWIHHPVGMSTRTLTAAFEEAVRQATAKQLLRPNAVDPLVDKNTGHGQAPGIPTGWWIQTIGVPVSWQIGCQLPLAISMFVRIESSALAASEPGASASRPRRSASSTSGGSCEEACAMTSTNFSVNCSRVNTGRTSFDRISRHGAARRPGGRRRATGRGHPATAHGSAPEAPVHAPVRRRRAVAVVESPGRGCKTNSRPRNRP